MLNNLLAKKISVFLFPLLIIILWESWLEWERAVIEIGLVSFLLAAGVIWYLTLRPIAVSQLQSSWHRKEFWRFFITPGFLMASVYLFLLIVENPLAQHLLIVGGNLLFLLILQNLFDRFYHSANYPSRSFESISGNVNSISLFLLATVFYSFSIFLNLPVWQLALLLLASATFLTYQLMWISGLELRQSWLYVLIIDLVVIELFWVLFFLPNTFYIKALVITIAYYLSVNLSRNYLIGLLNQRMVWRYLIVGGIILLLVLGTGQWL